MDKFGVDEINDPDAPKTGALTHKVCPACGAELRPVEDTGVLLCPRCGSKPFEEQHGKP